MPQQLQEDWNGLGKLVTKRSQYLRYLCCTDASIRIDVRASSLSSQALAVAVS